MQIIEISTFEELQEVEANWTEVHASDPEAHYFLSWHWIAEQLRQTQRPWTVLCAKASDDNPSFSGFLPLRIGTEMTSDGRLVNKLSLIGNGASDYAGFLCTPDQADQVAAAFWSHLESMHWSELHLDYVFLSQQRRRAFLQNFNSQKFSLQRITATDTKTTDHTICPYIVLPETFDAYLSDLSANSRQKLRRVLRQVEETPGYAITKASPETIETDIASFLDLWWKRWGGGDESNKEQTLGQMKAALMLAHTGPALSLVSLWSDGIRVAMQANIHDLATRRVHFYAAARDPNFGNLPAGLVLHAHCIRSAITNGYRIYDFMHGNEEYKRAFGTEVRQLERLVIRTIDGTNLGGKLDRRSLARIVDYADRIGGGDREQANEILGQVLTTDPQNTAARQALERVDASA